MAKRKLGEVARVLRSKNAGPFLITIDMIFDNRECAEAVARQLSPEAIAEAYGIDPGWVLGVYLYPQANAVKVTIKRRVPAGSVGDTDVYGAQQHAPLLELEVEDHGKCGG